MFQPPLADTSMPYVASETRLQHLIRCGGAKPRFLQGVFPFMGRGVFDLGPLNDALSYSVPPGRTAEVVYFRAGNLSDDLLYLTLSVNGEAVRYFPVGPKADFHVPLVIVPSYPAGTRFDVCLAAPRGLAGTVVVDVGLVEVTGGSNRHVRDADPLPLLRAPVRHEPGLGRRRNHRCAPQGFPDKQRRPVPEGLDVCRPARPPGAINLALDARQGRRPAPCLVWDMALGRVARELTMVQERYGRDAVGVFGGGGLTNEKAYLLGKFARVALGTPHIDYNGRFCMASEAAAGLKAFGIDRGLPFPLEDIPGADAILLAGGNPAETMPPIMQYFDAQRDRGGALIVADPRKTPTAQNATVHLQLTPGTDIALANGLLHIAAADGLLDHEFIAARTSGYDTVRRVIASYWPDRVERITGVPSALLVKAAHLLGEAPTAMALTARGAGQHAKGVDNTLAFINLILALGKAGKPHCGYGCITGQGNGQGGREHGQKADQLPGYRKIDNPAHRAHVAGVWGISPDELPGPGRSAYELLDSMGQDGGVRALLVLASNLVVSAPRAAHVEQRLDALDFLCVSDIFLSETAERADVVLPITQWAEEEGTMTNLEGRVLRRRQAVTPPEGVWTDAQVVTALAERLGRGRFFTSEPRLIFDELRRASAGGPADYSGITYERIEAENGVFWPCPSVEHPGTPRLFQEKFATDDGRARFHPVQHRPSAEEPDDDYPLYLTTGRVMAQYQSGTQTRRVQALRDLAPEPFVEIHPALAARFGISDGDTVAIATRRGEAGARARLTPTIRPDTLFMPFHWGGRGRANLLTNPALDPTSKMPEFKVCAARIVKTSA